MDKLCWPSYTVSVQRAWTRSTNRKKSCCAGQSTTRGFFRKAEYFVVMRLEHPDRKVREGSRMYPKSAKTAINSHICLSTVLQYSGVMSRVFRNPTHSPANLAMTKLKNPKPASLGLKIQAQKARNSLHNRHKTSNSRTYKTQTTLKGILPNLYVS